MSGGSAAPGAAARRVAIVSVAYVIGAGAVWVVASWVRPVLALPPAFQRLLAGGLVVGLPLAALLAWYYPKLGHHGIHPAEARDADRG